MAKKVFVSRGSFFSVIRSAIKKHWIILVSALIVVLIVIGVASFRKAGVKRMNSNASFAFSQAQTREDYEKIIKIYPQSGVYVPSLINIAHILVDEGNYSQAIEYYEQVAADYSNNYLASRALCDLGYIYIDMKEYSKAIHAFQKVLDKYPEAGWNNEASFNVALCYELMGNINKAENLYSKILASNPTTEWYNNIVYRLHKVKETLENKSGK
ncbi:MAG: tetratricopeptide repeat protein [Candidatus Ancaeobacter aquaticus]|nr:tetratricopeptide repeat protein [Candidatus Ancaeobacter aquaticus]